MTTETRCVECGKWIEGTQAACPHCHATRQPAKAGTVIHPFPTSTILLLLLGLGALALGALFLSQATMGVGLVAGACFLAIWARILQAGAHHTDVMSRKP
jgi:hypothetical protein